MFSVGLSIPQPVSFHLVVTKAGGCKLLSNTTEKAKENVREATGSLAAAKESSADAKVETVLSELGGILALKEEQNKTTPKAFLRWKRCFCFTPTSFQNSFVEH